METNDDEPDISREKIVDIDELMLKQKRSWPIFDSKLPIIGLKEPIFKRGSSATVEPSVNILQEKKEESFLEIPDHKLAKFRKISNEHWGRNSVSGRSDWGTYFHESQTDLLSLKNLRDGSGSTEEWDNDSILSLPKAAPKQSEDSLLYVNNGKVFVVYMKKNGIKFGYKDLSMTMEELSDWLSEDPKLKNQIPISKSFSLGKNNSSSLDLISERTIAETVGKFNPMLKGLVFFVGPVEGKMCYKMCASNLKDLLALTNPRAQFDEEKSNDTSV